MSRPPTGGRLIFIGRLTVKVGGKGLFINYSFLYYNLPIRVMNILRLYIPHSHISKVVAFRDAAVIID